MDKALYEKLSTHLDIEGVDLAKASVRQPVLYQEVSEQLSEAWKKLQELKIGFEFAEYETALRIRKEIEAKGEKATEGKIEALVGVDENLLAQKLTLTDAEHEYMKWTQLKRSFEMREKTITNLSLYFKGEIDSYQSH